MLGDVRIVKTVPDNKALFWMGGGVHSKTGEGFVQIFYVAAIDMIAPDGAQRQMAVRINKTRIERLAAQVDTVRGFPITSDKFHFSAYGFNALSRNQNGVGYRTVRIHGHDAATGVQHFPTCFHIHSQRVLGSTDGNKLSGASADKRGSILSSFSRTKMERDGRKG